MQMIDSFSYQCGMIDSLNQMVAAGIRSLALTPPLKQKAERDALIDYAKESCRRHGTKLYPEDDLLTTDLFPLSMTRGRFNILFYQADHVIEEYIRLKNRKESTVASRAYFGGNRSRLSLEFGRLLSYPEDTIQRLIRENTERETV